MLPVVVLLASASAAVGATTPAPDLPDPVDLGGTRVEVSTNPQEPTPLTAGLWADTLSGPGAPPANAHWFSYRRTMQYSSVLVGVTATSSADSDSLDVTVFDPQGTVCTQDSTSSNSSIPASAFGVLASVPPDDLGATEDPCVSADHLDVRVTRGSSTAEGDLPIALRVVEEAPVRGTEEDLPPIIEAPTVSAPDPTAPSPVDGATSSFDDAPDLEPGATVSDAVPEGGEHLYRVRLDWGQALAVQVDLPAQDEATVEALVGDTPDVDLTLFDPLRNSFDTGHDLAVTDESFGEEAVSLFDGTRPVTYLNRFDDGLVSVPGDYWVSVSVAPPYDPAREPVEVPIEVTVDVTGEVGEAPSFPEAVLSGNGERGPDGYARTTPYLVDVGDFRAEVSGTPDVADERATGSEGDETDVRRTAGLALGAASLLSILAGALLLRRRVSRPAAR